jgi:23S rRNA (pseudouridine1915-N3)-methyltransferase
MRVVIAAVGRPRDAALSAVIREYETRAARYWPLEVHEVREESARSSPHDTVRAREGERLASAIPAGVGVVACDERGRSMHSNEFATWLGGERDSARDVAFVIGGAYGLAESIRMRARFLLALAAWTLPHEMARLLLAEQLYRAGTILRGEPYHK